MPSRIKLSQTLQNQRLRRGLVWLALIVAVVVGVAVAAPPTREEALPWVGTVGA